MNCAKWLQPPTSTTKLTLFNSIRLAPSSLGAAPRHSPRGEQPRLADDSAWTVPGIENCNYPQRPPRLSVPGPHLDVGLYSNVLVAGNTLFVLFCAENGSALQLIDFVATLCCHYFCYWPLERQVGKGAIELLKALTNNPSMRKSLQFSDSWSQLGERRDGTTTNF